MYCRRHPIALRFIELCAAQSVIATEVPLAAGGQHLDQILVGAEGT